MNSQDMINIAGAMFSGLNVTVGTEAVGMEYTDVVIRTQCVRLHATTRRSEVGLLLVYSCLLRLARRKMEGSVHPVN